MSDLTRVVRRGGTLTNEAQCRVPDSTQLLASLSKKVDICAFDKLRHDVAIVIVDHHLDLALALSDRTVALERGSVTHIGPSAALSQDMALRKKVLWL